MLGRFVTGWLGLGFKFLVAQFLGVTLERVCLRSSGDFTLPVFFVLLQTSAGVGFTLERVCLRSSGGARAGSTF